MEDESDFDYPLPQVGFPELTVDSFKESNKSPKTTEYNCIAWAAGETNRKWQPITGYWPHKYTFVHQYDHVDSLVKALETVDYIECPNSTLEPGYEKVAIYGRNLLCWQHAARQLPNGNWTSKMGNSVDFEHYNLECLEGESFGTVLKYMRRKAQ